MRALAKPRRPARPRSMMAIGERLELTRRALGLNQTELCRRCGIANNTYNQWERGRARPGLDQAMRLCDALGLTLDWIYLGEAACLPHHIAVRLDFSQ